MPSSDRRIIVALAVFLAFAVETLFCGEDESHYIYYNKSINTFRMLCPTKLNREHIVSNDDDFSIFSID